MRPRVLSWPPNTSRSGTRRRSSSGAIPYRLTHPGSECGIGSEGIVCGEDGLVEAGGTVGTTIPDDLDQAPWWMTPLTSMFMHADILHVAINMLFLWIFGGAVEALMGRGRFLALYLTAGYVAAYSQALLDTAATGPVIGAAGAIAGALGAYAMLRPRGRIVSISFVPFFAGLFEVPAVALILAWFGLQLIPGVGNLGLDRPGERRHRLPRPRRRVRLRVGHGPPVRPRPIDPQASGRAAVGPRRPPDGLSDGAPKRPISIIAGGIFFLLIFGGLTVAALWSADLNVATLLIAAVSLFIFVAVVLALVGAVRNPPEE